MFYNKKFLLFAVFLDKIYIWKKSCSQDIGQILTANQTAGFLNQVFFTKKINEISSFLACWYRFTKIKSQSKIYCVSMVKNRCSQFGYGTLKLTLSQKSFRYFLHACTNSGKLKFDLMVFGWSWSKMAVAF